jgi:glutathione S-transferase
MVELLDQDIQTKEILKWKGLHLFHFSASSCSQKTRIVLNIKGLEWSSHEVDLGKSEHLTPWYLGINPRGLVPTLIMDGTVYIESNDIIQLLDEKFPQHKLIPNNFQHHIQELLHHENDLHLDLRTLTFRFTQPRGKTPRTAADLNNYRNGGSGTVRGKVDPDKIREIEFWEKAATQGITNQAIKKSAARFRVSLEELDHLLTKNQYLLSNTLSILDIAWFIYVNRLVRCGYPMEKLHPNVNSWFQRLRKEPEFAKEIIVPPEIQKAVEANHRQQQETKTTLVDVAGL